MKPRRQLQIYIAPWKNIIVSYFLKTKIIFDFQEFVEEFYFVLFLFQSPTATSLALESAFVIPASHRTALFIILILDT
jgi:hypothetical protein